MSERRLVVVSNRVPPPAQPGVLPAAGGLVAAVLPAVQQAGGLWIGWSGNEGDSSAAPRHRREGTVEFVTIDLAAAEVRDYYAGFCNQTLWPLMHGFGERAVVQPAQYEVWRRVNRRFASVVAEVLEPDDLVWVHDYHLLPLGAELRARGWTGLLGYFHHIPIPLAPLWERIPQAAEVAAGMRTYDLVGTQTARDARRLRGYVEAAPGDGPLPPIEAHPIGIDPARLRETAARHPADPFASEHRAGRQVLFGADRLDYSKGIPQRFQGYLQLLARSEAVRAGAVLVQWAAPSRGGIPEYEAERATVEELARDASERFGVETVRLELATLPPEVVAAGLRDADVCLVTSLSDGMNLVAKEFVAARREERPGVLILSDGCGAAEELTEALIVGAGNVGAIEAAIDVALAMPEAERRERWLAMRARVEAHDVHAWRRRFLEALEATTRRG